MSAPNQPTPAAGINRLVWRLFSRHRGRMLFFASSIAIGVGFLFAIGNLLDTLNASVANQTRELMTADLSISNGRAFSPTTLKPLKALEKKGYRNTQIVQFASMLRGVQRKKSGVLIIVKSIEKAYPFYGTLKVKPASYRKAFFTKPTVVIAKELAVQHGFKVGDKVRLGRAVLTIAGIIQQEPDQLFSDGIAPRILVSPNTLKQTKLVQYGSRLRYTWLLASPKGRPLSLAQVKALKKRLLTQLKSPYLRITAYSDAQPTLREVLRRVATFFIFVSLVALLLGAIGMAASVTAFLNEQLETVGIFRCLGFGPGDVTKLYHRLVLGIGVLGGMLGTALGASLTLVGQSFLAKAVSLPLQSQLHWSNVVEGLILSCILTVGLNYLTIWSLSRMAPRDILSGKLQQIELPRWGIAAVVIGVLLSFFFYAMQSSNSPTLALFFTGTVVGLVLGCLVLILGGIGLVALVSQKIHGSEGFAFSLRHGLRQLVRQRTRTLTFLLALTIGGTLIGTLNIIQSSLITQLRLQNSQSVPDLFLIDVQKDQVPGVKKLMKPHVKMAAPFSPLIRARLSHINGKPIVVKASATMTMEERRRMRFLTREYSLSYKDKLNPSETILAGRFWKPGTTEPEISITEGLARNLGVSVGSTLGFNIQGRLLKAKVTSLRRINWASMLPNFFVVLPVKALEMAPQTLLTSVAMKSDKDRRIFQRKLGNTYPNVTTLYITRILKRVQGILTYLVLGMKVLAWVCVFVGLLILAGTLSMGRAERKRKTALFRAFGASENRIRLIDGVEFASIGVLTALIVSLLSLLLSYLITYRINAQLHITAMQIVEILIASILLPVVVGFLSNRETYRASVMDNLRSSRE